MARQASFRPSRGPLAAAAAVVVMAAALLCGASLSQAGLVPRGSDVITGNVAAFEAGSGKLVVDGHTLYMTPQTLVQRRVEGRYEDARAAEVTIGAEVRASTYTSGGRSLIRQLELLGEQGSSRRQAK